MKLHSALFIFPALISYGASAFGDEAQKVAMDIYRAEVVIPCVGTMSDESKRLGEKYDQRLLMFKQAKLEALHLAKSALPIILEHRKELDKVRVEAVRGGEIRLTRVGELQNQDVREKEIQNLKELKQPPALSLEILRAAQLEAIESFDSRFKWLAEPKSMTEMRFCAISKLQTPEHFKFCFDFDQLGRDVYSVREVYTEDAFTREASAKPGLNLENIKKELIDHELNSSLTVAPDIAACRTVLREEKRAKESPKIGEAQISTRARAEKSEPSAHADAVPAEKTKASSAGP